MGYMGEGGRRVGLWACLWLSRRVGRCLVRHVTAAGERAGDGEGWKWIGADDVWGWNVVLCAMSRQQVVVGR